MFFSLKKQQHKKAAAAFYEIENFFRMPTNEDVGSTRKSRSRLQIWPVNGPRRAYGRDSLKDAILPYWIAGNQAETGLVGG